MRAEAARAARGSRVFQLAARGGFAVNGLLHVLMGMLALGVATGAGRGAPDADPSGALTAIAATPGGSILLWVLAAGLAALALWLAVEALLVLLPRHHWGSAVVTGVKALVYGALAAAAITIALGGRSDSAQDARATSAALLATPGGVIVLALAGIALLAVGVFFATKGIRRGFEDDLRLPDGALGGTITTLGVVGYLAKGIALGALGVLIITAAIATDPSEATGLDGALRAITELPFGVVLLFLVGAGLVAYGAYCGARARWARL